MVIVKSFVEDSLKVKFANFTISFLLRFNQITYTLCFDCFDGDPEVLCRSVQVFM
jgi:hypothetical protein